MTRGRRKPGKILGERRCIATRESLPKSGLVRFVAGPDGRVVPDILERLPGRGIWVKAERAALEKAVSGGLFARNAGGDAAVPEGLADSVERALAARVVELLAMSRKAGVAVAGFEKVRDRLGRDEVALLLHSPDCSPRQLSKLGKQNCNIVRSGCMRPSELGMAFARDVVIYAALSPGALGSRTIEAVRRLAGFRE